MINKQRVLDLFFDYVKIDSETGNEKEMAERVIADLEALGLKTYRGEVGAQIDSSGFNVYGWLEGDRALEPILLSAHMDTVVPGKGIEPYVENGIIRSRGKTILGGDDKSGIVAIIEALRLVKEQGIQTRPVEVLFTLREESGMHGAKHAEFDKLSSKWSLALDSSGDVGKIINIAPGQLKINATITGKSAHAGLAPQEGISAIMVASHGISKMKLLRIDEETTANIGTLKAESPTNIVCDTATIVAEARSRNYDKLVAQGAHMKQCLQDACDQFGATLDITVDTSYVGYVIPEDDGLIQFVSNKLGEMGITPSIGATGGGSDANIFNRNGIQSVVIGTGMSKVHSTEEEISVENLEKISELIYRVIKA